MDEKIVFPALFATFFLLFVGSFVYRRYKYGGWVAALFGAPIERTIGDVPVALSKYATLTLRTHLLGTEPTPLVGLEFSYRTWGSIGASVIKLTPEAAGKLGEHLQAAAQGCRRGEDGESAISASTRDNG